MGRKSRDKIKRSQQKQKQKQQTTITDKNKTVKTTENFSKYSKPACHKGFYEVHPHLFVGKETDLNWEILEKIDVLVPLNDLRGVIWDRGFRGDIMYIPIKDFSTLPIDVEEKYTKKIADLVNDGKNIAIFCMGGHGRTGYMASLVLYELGYKNPIHLLKTRYCHNVVESYEQLDAIASYCDNEDLLSLYGDSVYGGSLYDDLWGKSIKQVNGVYFWDLESESLSKLPKSVNTPYTDAFYEDEWITSKVEEADKINYMKTIEKIFSKEDDNTEDVETKAYTELVSKECCGNCAEQEDNYCLLYNCKVKNNDASCLEFSSKQ